MVHVTDQIETYLAGGLSPGEIAALGDHVIGCEPCAAALADARAADAAMQELFAEAVPSADFEERMIAALSQPHPWLNRPIIHPMVRRAAMGIAASLLIAGIGYAVNRGIDRDVLPGWVFLNAGRNGGNPIQTAGRDPRTIQQLRHSAIELTKKGDYKNAIGVVDQILRIDPKDVYASGVAPILRDRLDFRNNSNHFNNPATQPAVTEGRSAVLYDDILRYPADWSFADGRDGVNQGKSNGAGGMLLSWKDSNVEFGLQPSSGAGALSFGSDVPIGSGVRIRRGDTGKPVDQPSPASNSPTALDDNYYRYGTMGRSGSFGEKSGGGMGGGGGIGGGGGRSRGEAIPPDAPDFSLSSAANVKGLLPTGVERLEKDQKKIVASYYKTLNEPFSASLGMPQAGSGPLPPVVAGKPAEVAMQITPANGEASAKPPAVRFMKVTAGDVPVAGPQASTPPSDPAVANGAVILLGGQQLDQKGEKLAGGSNTASTGVIADGTAGGVNRIPVKGMVNMDSTSAEVLAQLPGGTTSEIPSPAKGVTNGDVAQSGGQQGQVRSHAGLSSQIPEANLEKALDDKAKSDADGDKNADGRVRQIEQERHGAMLEHGHVITDLQQTAENLVAQGKDKEAAEVKAQIQALDPKAGDTAKPNPAAPTPQVAPAVHSNIPAAARPKIIRTGEMEFEVDSFESSVSTITKVVEEEGGYISTTNSDKLPNGKVKGEVVLRVTPDRLDTLVLKLRGIGDLKTQNIRAQDITKQYTDLESRLKAAQIMCDQILEIIKSGKAQVKDLLEAEKQLGVYREKVEQLTGEINFYANQVALSTLTLTLFERDIRTPASASEVETVTMTVVTEKVDDAAAKAKDAIAKAKGRIIASQQSQGDEGQSTATIKAAIPPDAAEEVIARLKQLDGQLDHFERQRSQTTSNGSSPVDSHTTDAVKVKHEDVTIDLTLYNLAKLTPRRRTDFAMAAADVDEAKRALEEQVRSAGGRIVDSRTEYPRPDQKKGTISFDVPSDKADGLIATLKGLGEPLQISTIENPNGPGVTESKRGFLVNVFDMASVQPRRQTTLTLVTPTVDQAQTTLADQVKSAGGRVIGRKIEHPTPEQSVGILAFEIPTDKADAFLLAMKVSGEMLQVNTSDSAAAQNMTESKRGFQLTILDLASVMPRRVTSMTVVTNTVEASEASLVEQVRQAGGRVISRKIEHPAPDQSVGNLSFEVPTDKAEAMLAALKQIGESIGATTADNTGQPVITDAKRGFGITLRSLTTFKAGEAEEISLASANVRDTFNDLRAMVHAQAGRVLTEHLNEDDASNSVGQLEFEVSRDAATALEQQMSKDGQIVTRVDERRAKADDTIDSKIYVRLAIRSAEQLPPRQTSTLGVEVMDVQRAMDDLGAAALSAGGRQVDNPAISQNAGQTTATVQYDVPLQQVQLLVDKADGMGTRKNRQTSIDTHAPEGKLARARMTVTFETPATLSSPDDGLWAGIRRGLVTSLRVLSYSLTLIIIGLCVVVPFGIVLWGGWRGVRWARKSPTVIQGTPING